VTRSAGLRVHRLAFFRLCGGEQGGTREFSLVLRFRCGCGLPP
jgi:hypothetical protein